MATPVLDDEDRVGSDVAAPSTDDVVEDDNGIPAAKVVQPSELNKKELFEVLQGWVQADQQQQANWRRDAVLWYKFRAGDQWTAEDKAYLDAQQRPHIVFNQILKFLKAVAGLEINGRHEVAYKPRNTRSTAVNEVLTAASKWMSDGCDAEDEESAAFEDVATCGMGWCENRIDFIEEWNGKYIEEQIDPFEMIWDRNAVKKNLTDARRLSRARRMPLGDAVRLFPGFTRAQLDAAWVIDTIRDPDKTLEQKRIRDENITSYDNFDDTNEVTIVQTQWWELEKYWKVANLQDGSITDMTDPQYQALMQKLKMLGAETSIVAVELAKKVFKQAFLGSVVLKGAVDSPVKTEFTWKCVTGELDKANGSFFGLVKIMMDPQQWSNKWLSQALHILNTTAKGGVIMEEDAIEGDPRKFEDEYARPDSVTWVKRGAVKDGKIMAKPGQGMQQGYVELLQYANSALRDTTGINLELIGQQDNDQAGILEHYRKQAGMTILASLFDSLRRFRKQTGSLRLYYIQNYLADGRLIRIVGPDGEEAVPLARDKCTGEYDVVIDDSPTSPNMKERNWAIIQPMLAIFKDQLTANPQILVAILEYSPLPSRIVGMLKKFVERSQEKTPEQQKMEALQVARLVASINKDQSTAELNLSKAGTSEATAIYDMAVARNLIMKNDFHGLEAHLKTMAAASKMQVEQSQKTKNEAEARRAHADADYTELSGAIDAVTPIEHKEGTRDRGSPLERIRSHVPARGIEPPRAPPEPRQLRRPPSTEGMPPGMRRAPNGRAYVADPGRPGRWLEVVTH